jgi:thiol-disulfide isomerase/thioredoxin
MATTALLQDARRWTVLTLVVLTLGAGWTFLSRVPPAATTGGAPPANASPREGFSAPDFTLDLLGGGQVTLSELRGKVVVVNLWASWCPPCRAEMPAIEKVYRANKDRGLEVLAVNSTFQDSEADAAAFVRNFGLTFPIPLDRTGAVSARYLLRALPSTYFIDRRGVIRTVVIGGPMSEAVIQSKIEDLLKETP